MRKIIIAIICVVFLVVAVDRHLFKPWGEILTHNGVTPAPPEVLERAAELDDYARRTGQWGPPATRPTSQ